MSSDKIAPRRVSSTHFGVGSLVCLASSVAAHAEASIDASAAVDANVLFKEMQMLMKARKALRKFLFDSKAAAIAIDVARDGF